MTYSFKLMSYPANINQTHIFIVPANTLGQANMGNAGAKSIHRVSSVQYTLDGHQSCGGWTSHCRRNGKQICQMLTRIRRLSRITNATAVGTWTLRFMVRSTSAFDCPRPSPVAFSSTTPVMSQLISPTLRLPILAFNLTQRLARGGMLSMNPSITGTAVGASVKTFP